MTTDEIRKLLDEATKWPWGIEHTSERFWIGPMREDRKKIADLVVSLDTGEDYSDAYNNRQNANARLIAAAPTLARRVLELEEVLRCAIKALHNAEKTLTEELYHQDFCGESLPLVKARAALKETRDD